MKFVVNKKNIVIVLSCVLIVGICVGAAVFVASGRQYEMFTNTQSDQTASDTDANTAPGENGDEGVVEAKGVSVTVPSDIPKELDPLRYVKQAYELKYLMAIDSFSKAEDLPVNPTVQYAFCYLYAGSGCLVDYKTSAMTYREASETEIRKQIELLFGSCPIDVTSSDLYSAGKKSFEMWQPNYSRDVYATASVRAADTGDYQIEATYFENSDKKQVKDTVVITVRKADNNTFILVSMT